MTKLDVDLGALTRLQWHGRVHVDLPELTDHIVDDIVDAVYDHVDGGDYEDDSSFWEKATCEGCLVPADDSTHPALQVTCDDNGDWIVTDVPPLPPPPKPEPPKQTDDAKTRDRYRKQAGIELRLRNFKVDIPDDAPVSIPPIPVDGPGGWVQTWVWVDDILETRKSAD